MKTDPIQIILESSCWRDFFDQLSQFGTSPEFNKLKGNALEILTKYYLQIDPIFNSMLSSVWHHSELPINIRDYLKLPQPEVGVDLLAQLNDGTFCAIQCKFHQDQTQNVSYDELSTFFSVTERKETYEKLSHRLVCTSARGISNKVYKLHGEKLGFVTASDFQNLDEIKFGRIHRLIEGKPLQLKPFTPRPHQLQAIDKGQRYFAQNNNKGKIIHPCGSGKSLTAYWLTKRLAAKSVLIAVPSLALVKQTLNTWARESIANGSKMEWMAVCSDEDVSLKDDPAFRTYDLGIAVTTDPNKLVNFIKKSTEGLKIIVTTYQSSEVISTAAKLTNHTFEVGIFDEAHKTAGHRSKKFSHLIDDQNVSINKKIFLTATERQFKGDSTDFLSMDDQEIYGDLIDQLSYRAAVEEDPPILSDYRVTTVFVTKREIGRIINDNELTKANGDNYSLENDASTLAALISLQKLSTEKNIKHAISFHSTIKRAEEFRDLNNELNLVSNLFEKLHAYHISGKKSTGERNAEMDRFLSIAPSVISNARCLTEGVDVPAVDAVIFADPKQSAIDIVQAAGRAMRIHQDKELGYIIVPVIIDEGDQEIASDAFKQLITVIAALGINDERIIEEVKQYVSSGAKKYGGILEHVEYSETIEIDFAELVNDIQIKIWDRVSFAKSVIGEGQFVKWMRDNTSLSEKSMKNYSQAVRKISNDLVKRNLAFSSLQEISENADLKKLKDEYFSIDEFKELDTRGKSMYSSGFNKLIEYHDFKNRNHLETNIL